MRQMIRKDTQAVKAIAQSSGSFEVSPRSRIATPFPTKAPMAAT